MLLARADPPERRSVRLACSAFRRRHQATAKRWHAAHRAQRQAVSAGCPLIHVLSAGTLELTEERWARIAHLLPPQQPPTGRPNRDHRTMLAGMLWVARTGAAWRELPEQFGPWQTIHGRYTRWRNAGLWQWILDALKHGEDANTS